MTWKDKKTAQDLKAKYPNAGVAKIKQAWMMSGDDMQGVEPGRSSASLPKDGALKAALATHSRHARRGALVPDDDTYGALEEFCTR